MKTLFGNAQHLYAVLLALVVAALLFAMAVHRVVVCDAVDGGDSAGGETRRIVTGVIELDPGLFQSAEYYPPED